MSDRAAQSRQSIQARQATVGVVGLGYVGLPLAVAFASTGFTVMGFDINADRLAKLEAGQTYIADVAANEIARLIADGLLTPTGDMSQLAACDVILICVPTPLNKSRDPDISSVVGVAEKVAETLRPGQLIILESTTYPGTTREVIRPILERDGRRACHDFFLAFSPERIDPGNRHYHIQNTPKVVGGVDEVSTELASLLYQSAIETVVPVSSPEAAEMTKLLENTFRSVNIALANEVAIMCDRLGVDVWEVIRAAETKPFGFMPFWPGPGIGGHCIPLDPLYLSWKMRTLNYRARLIELAGEINAEMPLHIIRKITDSLNDCEKSVKGSDILVLGVAYKPDVDDVRESPALDIIGLLQERGARVSYSDPHVPNVTLRDVVLTSESLSPERLSATDCVVICTNHRVFDFVWIAKYSRLIVDTRDALRHTDNPTARVVTL